MFNLEIFTQPFMIHAWMSGTIVAILAAFIGFFIVIRSDSFIAHVLPEAGFAGGGAAVFFSLNPVLGLVLFSIGGGIMIAALDRNEKNEIATTLTLIAALGTGALFLGLTNQYAQGAYALLFGQIVGVSNNQTVMTLILGGGCLILLLSIWRLLLLTSLSPEIARTRGVPVLAIEGLFLLIVAVSTAVIVPVVGALLSFSLLVAPNAASIYFSSHPKKVLLFSTIFSVLNIWFSLLLGYFTGWPIGFFVSVIGMGGYIGARIYRFIQRRNRKQARNS